MADVRLTATNPADSSVVPVACNEKGELKLEEIPDQSFDGNLQGDLTVSGAAEFAGDVTVGPHTTIYSSGTYEVKNDSFSAALNAIDIQNASGTVFKVLGNGTTGIGGDPSTGTDKIILLADGAAEFASQIKAVDIVVQQSNDTFPVFRGLAVNGATTSRINSDGSVVFAGNKAGFTAEGYLWCTTRRGDTVILDVTSNGLASWVPYTPPTRLSELQDRWAEKDGILPVPHESSQDKPETKQ